MNVKKLGLTALAGSALILGACSTQENTENHIVEDEEFDLVYVAWDSEIASSNVLGKVLEGVGYDVNLVSVDSPFMWKSLAEGESDGTVSVWLPNMHAPDFEEYGDQVDRIGVNLEDATTGLTVPSYMDVESIPDLTDEAGQNIVSIEPGAGLAESAQEALDHYGLDEWSIQTSSSGAMVTELENAIADNQEVVVTGWTPHWMFQQHDLKMLEDPDQVFGEAENIETFARQGLQEDMPIAYSILENFQWDHEHMESVMLDIQEGADAEDAAETFIEENPELVEEWTAEAYEMADSQGSSSESSAE